jgi:UDP-3-O-[3-hydroxymyristoyl] glucosamine N-acyltransferase
MPFVHLLLGQIVDALGGELLGAARDVAITRVAPLESAGPGELSFLSNPTNRNWPSAGGPVIVAPLCARWHWRGALVSLPKTLTPIFGRDPTGACSIK